MGGKSPASFDVTIKFTVWPGGRPLPSFKNVAASTSRQPLPPSAITPKVEYARVSRSCISDN